MKVMFIIFLLLTSVRETSNCMVNLFIPLKIGYELKHCLISNSDVLKNTLIPNLSSDIKRQLPLMLLLPIVFDSHFSSLFAVTIIRIISPVIN